MSEELSLVFTDIPTEWKRRITGSINFYVTYDFPNKPSLLKEDLYQNWIEQRIQYDRGQYYFVSSEPFNPKRIPLSIQVMEDIKERFYLTYDKHIHKHWNNHL